ncbi:MAG: helix-turn-helix domain-containing protein [Patescibacteria group bacterium]
MKDNQNQKEVKHFLSIKEAAEWTDLSPKTIRRAIKKGFLFANMPPGVNRYRISVERLNQFMAGKK